MVSYFVTLLPTILFHIFSLFWMGVSYYWCGEIQLIVFPWILLRVLWK